MDQLACINVPELPLQLLLRTQPDWREQPVAVIDQDRPQGRILWVNERARWFHILPGMSYAAALSLSGSLHAAEVPAAEIGRTIESTARRLQQFSPHVEACREDPGIFWLNADDFNLRS